MYHFTELLADEVKLIGHALGKLPYEMVHPLLAKLQSQIAAIELSQKNDAIGSPPNEGAPAA